MIYKVIGEVLIFIGSLFLLLASIGIIRMPDVYNRMQAGTKATTLGALSIIMGVGIYHPQYFFKTLIISLFILLTNPVSSHSLARASHNFGIPLTKGSVLDRYAEDKEKGFKEEENDS
ncbi:MAG: monovalent cation/H(+) antiporter subunit G [Candidatus Aminicenantes bacterium]|nr:monovalent cation/H(+) antiporter subunit G [Candidatus Aminicenantes bacterium]